MSSDLSDQNPRRSRGLGSGLAALLGESGRSEVDSKVVAMSSPKTLPISCIVPGRLQPRTKFDESEIAALADSIRSQGIIQPILVRPIEGSDKDYEIIAGERRWRAAQLARLHEVPVIIHFIGDKDSLQIALIENLQRQELNVFEEAEAYQNLIKDFGNSQEEIAKLMGKSRSHVANTIRLLRLPNEIKDMVLMSQITPGHARVLLAAENPLEIARIILKRSLNVRQAEKLVANGLNRVSPNIGDALKDANTQDLERHLTNRIGLKVSVSAKKRGGNITIKYDNLEQLDEFLKKLS